MSIFRIHTSANWLPKYKRLRISHATPLHKVPKISQLKASRIAKVDAGEDAFFLTSTPRHLYLGVADGVGSWESVGVDPSQISWTLMNNASTIIKETMTSMNFDTDPTPNELLDQSYKRIVDEGSITGGSSTALIASINKQNGTLNASNLGDSSFIVIRDRKQVVFRSKEQLHFFNCPFQLSIVPDSIPIRSGYIKDQPKDADNIELTLEHNDLVIMATDGYFDNMFDEDTISIIQNELPDVKPVEVKNIDGMSYNDAVNKGFYNSFPSLAPKANQEVSQPEWLDQKIRKLSQKLAEAARLYSLNPKRRSPWTDYALSHYQYHESGGKIDDITVLVALVQKEQ